MSVTTTVLVEVQSSSQHPPKFTRGRHVAASVRKSDEVGTEVTRVIYFSQNDLFLVRALE